MLVYINIISLTKGVLCSLNILIPSTQLDTTEHFGPDDTVESSNLKQSKI